MSIDVPADCLHEYHFVIGRNMKQSLKSLDLYSKAEGVSGVIVKILKLLNPMIKKEHELGRQRNSRYMLVSDNPAEKREHVHVYFPVDVYRELKLMQQDLNTYSIAQLVREFCGIFLGLVEEYGDGVYQVLEELFKQWREEDEFKRLTTHEIVRQLSIIIHDLPSQNRLINIYNNRYSPLWLFRI